MSSERDQTGLDVSGNQERQLLVPPFMAAALKSIGAGAYSSLDLSGQEGKIKLADALMGDTQKMETWINRDITVVDVFVTPFIHEDQSTGEIKQLVKTVLFLQSGERLFTTGKGIQLSLQLAFMLFGSPPWTGLRGKVLRKPLQPPKSWEIIEWDRTQLTETTDAPKTTTAKKKSGASPK